MRKNAESILFWGSLWGLEEATLGHFLHMLPVNIGWVFYFPLAYAFMRAVYHRTGRISSILCASFLACSIKLSDLLLTVQVQKVVNPAAAIVLEGAAVFGLCLLIEKRPGLDRFILGKALAASLTQEILFIIYIAAVTAIIPSFGALPELRCTPNTCTTGL